MSVARPQVRAFPPRVDHNATLFQCNKMPDSAVLSADLSQLGTFHVIDQNGSWLLASRFEPGFSTRLWLPRGRQLYLRSGQLERPLVESTHGYVLGEPHTQPAQARSLVGDALSQGLFAMPYGPAFYRGYRAAVLETPPSRAAGQVPAQNDDGSAALWVAAGAGALAILGGAASIGSAVLFTQTKEQVPAMEYFTVAAVAGGVSLGLATLSLGAVLLATGDDSGPG